MYRYDAFDRELVHARVRQFADQIARRLSGELDEDSFRRLRLLNGLYLQLHAYMLRVPIPYGVLSSRKLRALAEIAERHDRGYAHFTTRQNIQFHWIRLEEVPAILERLAEVELTPIQACGNSIRNITSDPQAGVAADEIADPRPWAELLRQYLTLNPEFLFLPRKFKMAITGAVRDRALIRAHDVGLRLYRDPEGALAFEVYVGGGLGRTPMLAPRLRAHLPAAEMPAYVAAILRVYNLHGRRDHLYKSRIKILVHDLGLERFREEVEREYAASRDGEEIALVEAELARLSACFRPPPYEEARGEEKVLAARAAGDPAFARFLAANVFRHRVAGYRIVGVSLKPPGGVPGDVSAAQMRLLADLADRFSFGELRTTHEQNLLLPHVRAGDVHELWQRLEEAGLATPNLARATDIVSCPGLDYCNLATARSIPVAQELARRLEEKGWSARLGPLDIRISGCINACGQHHVGHIGVLGLEKRGRESYQITLGGNDGTDAALGRVLGPGFSREEIVPALLRILEFYLARRRAPEERFVDFVRRSGIEPLREVAYAPARA